MRSPDIIHLPLSTFVKVEPIPLLDGAPDWTPQLYGLFLTDKAQQLHELLYTHTVDGLRPVWLEQTDLFVLRQSLDEVLE